MSTSVSKTSKTIVFDFGGVLVDWDPRYLYRKLFNGDTGAMERFLAEIDFWNWEAEIDRGLPFAAGVARLCAKFPHYADLIQAFDTHWEETISGPIAGSVDLLQRLSRAGYALFGLSNWSIEKFAITRPKYAFFDLFSDIVISGEVKLAKPDPRIFTLFLEKIVRDAGDCFYIDDSLANIAAADRLGFQTIHFQSPGQLARELAGKGLLPDDGQSGV